MKKKIYGSGTGAGVSLNRSGMGVGVNLPGAGWDGIVFKTLVWEWDGTRFLSMGVGRDRSENPLPCHPLLQTTIKQKN